MTRVANTTHLWHEDVGPTESPHEFGRELTKEWCSDSTSSSWFFLIDTTLVIQTPWSHDQAILRKRSIWLLARGIFPLGLQEAFRFLVSNFRGCSWITDVSGRAEISSIENEIGKNKRPLPRSNATNFYPKRVFSSGRLIQSTFMQSSTSWGISRNLTT